MIKAHGKDYKKDAWKSYTMSELGQWVHLLTKRAEHRTNPDKRNKDLYDARNYLKMMENRLSELENKK